MTQPLRPEQFEALLQRLGRDRESAGARYQELRNRLVTVFEYRRCPHPEELADETLDRVARRLQEIGADFVGGDPAKYAFGVAWNVARESFRRPSAVALPDKWEQPDPASRVDQGESETDCLDRCLARLGPADRSLALDYHRGDRSARIQRRSELARELGLSVNALRLKIHRLTVQLRTCVLRCMEQRGWAGAPATS